jgi:hypothetical protein
VTIQKVFRTSTPNFVAILRQKSAAAEQVVGQAQVGRREGHKGPEAKLVDVKTLLGGDETEAEQSKVFEHVQPGANVIKLFMPVISLLLLCLRVRPY